MGTVSLAFQILRVLISDGMGDFANGVVMALETPNVEVNGAAQLYRVASVWTAGLALFPFEYLSHNFIVLRTPAFKVIHTLCDSPSFSPNPY